MLGRAFFLIDAGGARVGCAVFTFGFDHEAGRQLATITDLRIEASHRRRGLVRFAAEMCRATGVRGLELQYERYAFTGKV